MTTKEYGLNSYFARCFLMPEEEYIRVFREHLSDDGNTVNTPKIAEYFHVPISEASQRGVELGLIRRW